MNFGNVKIRGTLEAELCIIVEFLEGTVVHHLVQEKKIGKARRVNSKELLTEGVTQILPAPYTLHTLNKIGSAEHQTRKDI